MLISSLTPRRIRSRRLPSCRGRGFAAVAFPANAGVHGRLLLRDVALFEARNPEQSECWRGTTGNGHLVTEGPQQNQPVTMILCQRLSCAVFRERPFPGGRSARSARRTFSILDPPAASSMRKRTAYSGKKMFKILTPFKGLSNAEFQILPHVPNATPAKDETPLGARRRSSGPGSLRPGRDFDHRGRYWSGIMRLRNKRTTIEEKGEKGRN